MYRIFISSVQTEFAEERRLLKDYIERLGTGLPDLIDLYRKAHRLKNGPVNGPVFCDKAKRLLAVVERHPGLRKTKLCELTGFSDRTLKRYLSNDLADRVEFRGAPKTGGYYLKSREETHAND